MSIQLSDDVAPMFGRKSPRGGTFPPTGERQRASYRPERLPRRPVHIARRARGPQSSPIRSRLAGRRCSQRRHRRTRDRRHRGRRGQSFGPVRGAVLGACLHVAEVPVAADGMQRVHRAVAAMDCCMVVNPELVRRQVEGSIAFGLGAKLREKITFAGGRVEQTDFDAYALLRMPETRRSRCISCRAPNPPAASASPARRRSPRRSSTRSSPRQAGVCGPCR